MKTNLMIGLLVGATLLAGCTPAAGTLAVSEGNVATEAVTSNTAIPSSEGATGVVTSEAGAASSDAAGLTYVREEEKLARDVYQFLYEQWGMQVFSNIASSEQTHTAMIQGLLGVYGLPDPAADTQPGQFSDPDLQALYDQLTAEGSLSLAEALKVGAAVEEIDILDLQARLNGDLPEDIRFAYENLVFGSYNHLSAFTSSLQRQSGETYAPAYMSQEAYEQALSQAVVGGNGNGNGYRAGQP